MQRELDNDRARAERAGAERRRRQSLHNFVIRMVSLAIFLTLWQIAGSNIDPVLFTTPSKVAVAAVTWWRAASCGSRCGRA